VERPLWIMMAAVLLVLLIAIVNVTSLLLARAHARAPEMAMRLTLGASHIRLARQLLIESCLLAVAGAAGGCVIAFCSLVWMRSAASATLPRLSAVRLDLDVLTFTLALSLGSGLLAGFVPAFFVMRERFGVNAILRRRDPARIRALLTQAEIAFSLVLLTGAGLLLLNFARLTTAETGFHAPLRETLVTGISIRGRTAQRLDRLGNNPADIEFFDRLLGRLRAAPGIQSVAICDALPPNAWWNDDTFTIRDRPWTAAEFPSIPQVIISPEYFGTTGIPLLSGREFNDGDNADKEQVVIISKAVAEHHFPGQDPIGNYIKPSQPELTSAKVNGQTFKSHSLESSASPAMFTIRNSSATPWKQFTGRIVRDRIPRPT
jgi:putative ABC transport system permease protein